MMKLCTDNRGVSMLEVLVVTTIIGLLAVAARPSVKGFLENLRLWSAANSTKQHLILAKTRALADPSIHAGVFFDTSSAPHAIQAFFDNDTASLNDNIYTSGKDHIFMPRYVLSKTDTLKILSNGNIDGKAVIFRGDGSAKASIKLCIKNKSNKCDTISVLSSTGRIRISKNF